jgi:hypothetical protein
MTDATKLAESLRAMRRNAVAHWAPHGQVPRYAVTMDQVRLGDLTDAAYLIDALCTEIQSLKDAAHGLSTLAGELAADLDKANGGADDPHLSARFEAVS